MTEKLIQIWDGCAPNIADAINKFSERYGPHSVKSRHYSIYRLIKEIIDPQWRIYVMTFQNEPQAMNLFNGVIPSNFSRAVGFFKFENWIIQAIRTYRKETTDLQTCLPSWISFVPTMETMREFVLACRLKQPKKLPIANIKKVRNLNVLRARSLCELCGNPTELKAFSIDSSQWNNSCDDTVKLSGRYCLIHRPVNHAKICNSEYKRAIRSKVKFEIELRRLELQSWSISTPRSKSGDDAIDFFILNSIAQRALYPDEEGQLRNMARYIVDKNITDIKKKIVMHIASGRTQNEVAAMLNISSQAISKALKSIPAEYRFDLLLKL